MSNFICLLGLFNAMYWISILAILYNRNNFLLVLIAMETSYLMIIVLFAVLSSNLWGYVENQTYCLIFLVLAASESATGLAIVIVGYNYVLKTTFTTFQILHG